MVVKDGKVKISVGPEGFFTLDSNLGGFLVECGKPLRNFQEALSLVSGGK